MPRFPTPPLFDAPLGENPLGFLDENYPAKTRGMLLPYGENFMILTSTVFDWSTRVTDRRTALSIRCILSRAKNSFINRCLFNFQWLYDCCDDILTRRWFSLGLTDYNDDLMCHFFSLLSMYFIFACLNVLTILMSQQCAYVMLN